MLAKPQGFPRKLGGCAGLDPRLRSAVSAGVGDGERGLRRGLRAPGVGVRPKWVLEYSPSNKRIRYFVSITYVRTGLWTAHKFCGGGPFFTAEARRRREEFRFCGICLICVSTLDLRGRLRAPGRRIRGPSIGSATLVLVGCLNEVGFIEGQGRDADRRGGNFYFRRRRFGPFRPGRDPVARIFHQKDQKRPPCLA